MLSLKRHTVLFYTNWRTSTVYNSFIKCSAKNRQDQRLTQSVYALT
jgi:hypothetical protein